MIHKFNGVFFLIIFLVHFFGYAFYAYKCLFDTKVFLKKYGVDVTAAIMTRFFGSMFVGSVLMALYIMLIRPDGLEATWAFFNLIFLQNLSSFIFASWSHQKGNLGVVRKTSKEGIIAETWAAYFHGETMILGPAILILVTAGMTGFYMSRMWFMTFAGQPKSDVVDHVHETTPWIKEPLFILTLITAVGGFALATLGIVDFLSNESHHLSLHGHSLIEQIQHELEHAFLPEDQKLRMVGWTTILLSFVIGPIMAARIHGGQLKDGQRANIFVGWLVKLSGKFGTQDVTWLAESQLAEALDKRLYFDDLYEGIIARTVIPFAEFSAWFDKNVIDGIIKQIESNSVLGSVQIRKVTTGNARDYILMATVGALCIFALLMGVNI